MTQEDKQLLLIDLCARLPYGIKCDCVGELINVNYVNPNTCMAYISRLGRTKWESIEVIKPYLRPMSSMTEEEFAEYEKANDIDTADSAETLKENMRAKSRIRISKWYHGVDWLIAHHFDYRGLIPMGLALETSEGMYKEN